MIYLPNAIASRSTFLATADSITRTNRKPKVIFTVILYCLCFIHFLLPSRFIFFNIAHFSLLKSTEIIHLFGFSWILTTTLYLNLYLGSKVFSFLGWECGGMGRLFVLSLEGKIYSCKHCRTHLALCEDIVSKVVDQLKTQTLILSFCGILLDFVWVLMSCCLLLGSVFVFGFLVR